MRNGKTPARNGSLRFAQPALGVGEAKSDVTPRGAARTHARHGARGTDAAGGADALLPAALGDVDGGALLDWVERELCGPRLARRRRGVPLALCDGSRDAAADGQLSHVLVVEDDAGLGVSALDVRNGPGVDARCLAHVQDLKVLLGDGDVWVVEGHHPGADAGDAKQDQADDGVDEHFGWFFGGRYRAGR